MLVIFLCSGKLIGEFLIRVKFLSDLYVEKRLRLRFVVFKSPYTRGHPERAKLYYVVFSRRQRGCVILTGDKNT